MEEKYQIWYCLQKIEEKLQWKPHAEWKDYEFKLLKKKIQESSGIQISTHTLKRLFGKLKYRTDYRPQHATKDALANFLGHGSWEEFIRESHEQIRGLSNADEGLITTGNRSSKLIQGKRVRNVLLPVLVIALLSLGFWFILNKFLRGPGPYEFSAEGRDGVVPLTVKFRFDISEIRSDQIMIDFDYIHPSLGSEFFLTDRTRTFLNHTYQIPGVYHPKLIWKNTPLDSLTVVVRSEGWVSFYHPEEGTNQFWMDNMYRLKNTSDLTFSRKNLASFGLDTLGVYYITHRLIDDFGISGDDFTLKAGFMNGPESGGISCYDCRFTVLGEHSFSLVEFVESNCHRYSRVKFGDNYYVGDYHDLSALTFSPGEYHEMSMEVKEKQAVVYLDGISVYEIDYGITTGEIKGIEIFFKGSGIVDYLSLSNNGGDTLYFEDFGRIGSP